jgi:adenylate kinase
MSLAWGLPATSLGEILRKEQKLGTKLGLEAERITSLGHLVPDELAISVIENWLSQLGWSAAQEKGFILDGTPRTIGQADALHEMLTPHNCTLTDVIYLEVGAATVEDRVRHRVVCDQCGHVFRVGMHVTEANHICPACGGHLGKRQDDDPGTLAARLQEYHDKTAPLIEYYEERGLLRRVDARMTPQEIFEVIKNAVGVLENSV